jgi:hypothetical protein
MRTRVRAALTGCVVLAAVGGGLLVGPAQAGAAAPRYSLVNVGKYGGEPSIAASPQGVLYDTTPSGGTILYRSTNQGRTWNKTTTADPSSGDTCVATDQSGAVYECNLAGSKSVHPLEADSWKSVDEGQSWMYGNDPINLGANICGTSCNPFGVDRQWEDAYISPGKTTKQALVVLAYHDFYGPSHIWANISTDGGKTFGAPINIFANGNPNEQNLWALANTSCSTVPAGARIAKSGKHAGRIYVSWIASDPESAATGCNVSMVQAFHNVFVAWSDDHGATWNLQLAYDAGFFHDASTPFASFTLDNQGNPYVAIDSPAPSENAQKCSTETTGGSQSDTSCDYHVWVVWSKDGGTTWDGGGGMLPGTAAKAYEVDPSKKPQTDVFPTIAAGLPGHVAVGWLGTNTIVPTDPLGKFEPGGCAGPATAGVPTYPPTCKWNLFAAESLNLTQKPGQESWTIQQLTPKPMHVGDICNLGIACIPNVSNRNLLDFNSEVLDPTTGCVHIAYADDSNPNVKLEHLRVANQVSGPSIEGSKPCGAAAGHHGGHGHHHHHQRHHHHKRHHHRHRTSKRPKHSRGFTG